MKKIFFSLLVALMATGATAQTGNVEMTGGWSTTNSQYEYSGTFIMPEYDVEVTTELWYKLDETSATNAKEYGTKKNVFLKRTLQSLDGKNKGWNTFCAPFDAAIPSGWTVKELTAASIDNATLTLTFGTASSIVAGKPYLVQVSSAVTDPTFENITQVYTGEAGSEVYTTVPVTYNGITFQPVLAPESMTANDKTKLFVSGGDKLTFPNADGNINAFRAYFSVPSAASARAFVMDFGDGEQTTGIIAVESSQFTVNGESSATYDLQGRKVQEPTRKGVYIQNGKKVIIK